MKGIIASTLLLGGVVAAIAVPLTVVSCGDDSTPDTRREIKTTTTSQTVSTGDHISMRVFKTLKDDGDYEYWEQFILLKMGYSESSRAGAGGLSTIKVSEAEYHKKGGI